MLAKILMCLTPVIWLLSLGMTSYGALITAPLVAVMFIAAGALRRQPNRAPASSALLFAALWWIVWPAAIAALVVAVGVLVPRKFWLVGAFGVGAMVVLAFLNPPVGPSHLASVAGITLATHAVLVGAVALVALRGRP